MVSKNEYDFLTWTSFPSSAKIVNDFSERTYKVWWLFFDLAVTPGATLKAEVKVKQTGVIPETGKQGSLILDSPPPVWPPHLLGIYLPSGTFDWRMFSNSITVPPEVRVLRGRLAGGAGSPDKPGITWFDDLKIYMNDVLIYANDFGKWDPVIGAGVGAPIGGAVAYLLKEPLGPMVSEAVGAVLGGALGGGVGLLTGLGIIPVPQIPTFGAAPEGPGAPARLGKYLITG